MASDTQFLVSMKFVGIDAVSPEIKKVVEQTKQIKQQMNGMFNSNNNMKKFFDDMSNGFKNINKQLDTFKKSMGELKSSGIGNILGGTAVIAPIMKALDAAGQMQTKMITIAGATGANNGQLKAIQDSIRASSNVTKFSSSEVADIAVKEATSGMNPDQVAQLTPILSKFAEVQSFGKGSSPAEAVTQAISAAHMLGIYDPSKLDAYLNKFNSATFMTPGSTGEFFDTFKYLAPTAKGMGMGDDDILLTAALSNRVGMLGSMGGTEAADMIMRGIPGLFGGDSHVDKNGHLKAGKPLKAMMDLGLASADGSSVFFNNQGQFLGIKNFIDQLAEASHKVNPMQFTKDLHAMLGTQGMKIADILSARGGEQLEIIQKQMNQMKSITEFQDDYNKGYEGQLAQLKTNIGNLEQQVGGALLPTATNLVNSLQPYADVASKWIEGHQKEMEQYGKAAAEFGGFLLALGGVKLAIGTLGSFITPILKLGPNLGAVLTDTILIPLQKKFGKQAIESEMAIPKNIQANVVNVYGKSIVEGSGTAGGGIIETGGGLSGETTKAKGRVGTAVSAAGSVLKGAGQRAAAILPVSIAMAGWDVMTAPEGQKVQTAVKSSGDVIGGWAGAEAGAAMGASIGSVIPGIGTAVGGVLGGIIGAIAGSKLADSLTDAATKWISSHTLTPKLSFPTQNFSFYNNGNPYPGGPVKNNPFVHYYDNSTHNYDIQATEPTATADEIQNNRGNMLKLNSLLDNSNN